jgi:hypothetical protein
MQILAFLGVEFNRKNKGAHQLWKDREYVLHAANRRASMPGSQKTPPDQQLRVLAFLDHHSAVMPFAGFPLMNSSSMTASRPARVLSIPPKRKGPAVYPARPSATRIQMLLQQLAALP